MPKKVKEEIVTVPTSSVEDAARGAMLFATLRRKGDLVVILSCLTARVKD